MKRRQILKAGALGVAATLACGGALLLPAAAQNVKITAENWGEMVGFKPDLGSVKVKKGQTIDKSNLSQAKDMMLPGLQKLVSKYALKMKITDYEPHHPSLNYIKATNANLGKTKYKDVGKDVRKKGISNYEGGMPFPQPKNGLELAYDFLSTYGPDDAERYYDVTWISAKRGVETTEYWHWLSLRTAHRYDVDPKPAIDKFAKDRIAAASLTFAIEPYDKKGFGALYFGSLDPVDITGHIYVPAMRRVLRHSFGTRGDSWNATDFLYEDVGGYLGAAEWMDWKIVDKKVMLLPIDTDADYGKGAKTAFDIDTWPHWNPTSKWQPRPVYVLEAKPKLPDYPYSRMTLLVDAETFFIPYKEAYDKKGELWKIILIGANESDDEDTKPMMPGFASAIDLQAEHASLVSYRTVKYNADMNPNQFSVANLKRKGN